MALFRNDKGNYVQLSNDYMKKLRRVEQVKAVDKSSRDLIIMARALSSWLEQVETRGNRVGIRDLAVARLFNRKRLSNLARDLETKVEELVVS